MAHVGPAEISATEYSTVLDISTQCQKLPQKLIKAQIRR